VAEPPRCLRHPDGNSSRPCRDCGKVREHSQRAEQAEARLAGARHCPSCDGDGYILLASRLAEFGQPKPARVTALFAPGVGCDPLHAVAVRLLPVAGVPQVWLAVCPHGTQRPGDKRDKPGQVLADLEAAGYESVGADAWALAGANMDAEEWFSEAVGIEVTAEMAREDAEEAHAVAVRAWLFAEGEYRQAVRSWLNAELRHWERWLAAEKAHKCQRCDADGVVLSWLGDGGPMCVRLDGPPSELPVGAKAYRLGQDAPGMPVIHLVQFDCRHDASDNCDMIGAVPGELASLDQLTAAWNASASAVVKAHETCEMCDAQGTQVDTDGLPIFLRRIDDDFELTGGRQPLVCPHDIDANCAEFVQADQADLKPVRFDDPGSMNFDGLPEWLGAVLDSALAGDGVDGLDSSRAVEDFSGQVAE
jgi:hypothetical protein